MTEYITLRDDVAALFVLDVGGTGFAGEEVVAELEGAEAHAQEADVGNRGRKGHVVRVAGTSPDYLS